MIGFRHRMTGSRGNAGFSLVELLATLAILALVGTIVVTGIPAAHNAYVRAVDSSNAQALLAMSAQRLRGELSVANTDITPLENAGGNLITFQSDETGYKTSIKNDADGLHLVESAFDGDLTSLGEGEYKLDELLVPASAAAATEAVSADARLVTCADGIEYDKTRHTFKITNLRVERDGKVLANAKIDTLEVRVL